VFRITEATVIVIDVLELLSERKAALVTVLKIMSGREAAKSLQYPMATSARSS
jgi:hypothetical protein